MRSFWLALLLIPTISFGQSDDTAQRIYKSSQDSVFLVYLNDSSGSPTALGSAFLVAERTLVTNAHVANAGSPVLAVGPVRLPLKVVRIDRKNDLAVLSVDVDLTSSPLPLATGTVSPGEQIFAIGNPEGLEKSISQGIVSGLRNRDDRNLLQITSPISHGSSGGPILNARGEVVGVAVGMLEDGQNLNFAVPVSYVRSILEAKRDTAPTVNVREGIGQAQGLLKSRGTYSQANEATYNDQTKQLIALVGAIVPEATSETDLRELACVGTADMQLSDSGILAAQKLTKTNPSATNGALLSYVLYDRVENESIVAAYATKNSDEMTHAVAAQGKFLSEAEIQAQDVLRRAKGDDLLIASYVLGNVRRDQQRFAEAISLHGVAAAKSISLCGVDLTKLSLQALIGETDSAKLPDQTEKWFRRYVSLYAPTPYEWDAEGDRRVTASDYSNALDADEKAAEGSASYAYDYCYATPIANALPDQGDRVLADGRKCVDASVGATADDEPHFKKQLPIVYRDMAAILESRGVFQQALEYVKESLNAEPNNAFALDTEADIFADLERNTECISAETAAIRASDGKYPFMQFRLGYCYFATENWSQAATSFRLAAEGDKTNAVYAYDLGLSLSRQGFETDAQRWFREALNRKPDAETKAKILSSLPSGTKGFTSQ